MPQRPHQLTPAALGALGALAGLGLLAAVVLGLGASASPSTASAPTTPDGARGVVVTGLGTVTGRPDVLRFTVGVEVSADTVDAALAQADAAAERVLAALRDRGVPDADLQTASVQIHPRYDEQGRTVTGYTMRQDVAVTLRDLGGAGATMGAAVTAGGDAARLSGVAFSLEDDAALLAGAREQAFAQARAKAEQYADLAGRDLGPVLSVRESVRHPGPQPVDVYGGAAAAERAVADVPLAPGSADATVTVEVQWELV